MIILIIIIIIEFVIICNAIVNLHARQSVIRIIEIFNIFLFIFQYKISFIAFKTIAKSRISHNLEQSDIVERVSLQVKPSNVSSRRKIIFIQRNRRLKNQIRSIH